MIGAVWKNPGVGGAWADIVLIAPEAGLPLLFIETDNCFEDAPRMGGWIPGRGTGGGGALSALRHEGEPFRCHVAVAGPVYQAGIIGAG
jgi:hypothetical protein